VTAGRHVRPRASARRLARRARPSSAGTIQPRRGILRLHTCHMSATYLINAKNSPTYAMAVTLTWWIRASWLIWGSIVHRINHIARINPDISCHGTPRVACVSRRTGATAGGQTAGESADLTRRIRATRRIWSRIEYQIRRVGHFLHVIFETWDTAGAYGTLGAYGVIGAYERVSAGLGGVCPGRWRCVSWQVAVRADGWRCAGRVAVRRVGWGCARGGGVRGRYAGQLRRSPRKVCARCLRGGEGGAGWWLGLVEVFGLDA
jgi:hypothetical protein